MSGFGQIRRTRFGFWGWGLSGPGSGAGQGVCLKKKLEYLFTSFGDTTVPNIDHDDLLLFWGSVI